MADADEYSSDADCVANIYPDPDHAAQFPWSVATHDFADPQPGDASKGSMPIMPRLRSFSPDPQERMDGVFSPEQDDVAEDHLFSEDESDISMSSRGHDKPVSRAKRLKRGQASGFYGRPSRGGRGANRGPRQALEPEAEFKVLYSQATDLFVARDYHGAEQRIQRAIRINPEIFAAHSLLSAIYMERGNKEQALTALFYGAHTRPTDKNVWVDVAKLILERAGNDHLSAVRDAIYCYNRIVGLDSKDLEARRHRAALNCELGNVSQALTDYGRVLSEIPEDIDVLRRLVQLYTDLGEAAKAIKPFDDCISHYQFLQIDTMSSLNWSDANVYAELCIVSQEPRIAIQKLKALARWLLGRLKEQYWSECVDDDREYDALDQPRRMQVSQFCPGMYDKSAYGLGLPLEIRVKLGILRLEAGNVGTDDEFKEALRHFDWLEPSAVRADSKLFDYPDLFRDVGDALRKQGRYLEALRFYEPLKLVDLAIERSYLQNVAHCYEELHMFDQAERCYELILEHDASSMDVRLHLANMFELAGMPERALEQLTRHESYRVGSHPSASNTNQQCEINHSSTASIQIATSSYLTLSTIRQIGKRKVSKTTSYPKESLASLHDLDGSWLQMKLAKEHLRRDPSSARKKWITNARIVTDNFRSQSSFFPIERNSRFSGYRKEAGRSSLRMATDLHQQDDNSGRCMIDDIDVNGLGVSLPNSYCGVSFEKWLDVFLEYALLLSQHGDRTLAYAILESAAAANVFRHSPQRMFYIHICWLVCATNLNDSDAVCSVARYFIREYPSVTDAYRLFVALNRVCQGRSLFFNATPSQKFVLRQLKATDVPILREEEKPTSGKSLLAAKPQSNVCADTTMPEKMDIALLMLYGNILYSGTSYTSALNYFFRAYALDPSNPMISLCLALGYLHYALKRQSENRHYLIMQGISFLFAYYNLRRESGSIVRLRETEYNIGRACEMLGLTHLAVNSYRQCLALNDVVAHFQRDESPEEYAIDAAFALQRHSLANGDLAFATLVTRMWLVV